MLSKTFPVNQIWCRKRIAPCKGIRIPESGTILLRESEILCFGIRNSPQGIPNPTNDWNPESSSTDKYWNSVPGIRNPQRGIQNPRLSRIPLHGAKHRKKQSLWNKNLFLLAHKCSYEATTETFQNFVKRVHLQLQYSNKAYGWGSYSRDRATSQVQLLQSSNIVVIFSFSFPFPFSFSFSVSVSHSPLFASF